MDHALWGGRRDWSVPLRALVAGGGTGDGLIQLAQVLKSAGAPAEITYLDLSASAREIAEARARTRGLDTITFRTGSLLEAGAHGPFDYIDCCGVLHHLADPEAGFRSLREALAPGGGMGMMVYAPHGRSGVYPLQEAFGAILGGLSAMPRRRPSALPPVYSRSLSGILSNYDASGSIGRRYARADEIGVPWCITIDHQSLDDGSATVRNRNNQEQVRVSVAEIPSLIQSGGISERFSS
mgnify:CR=1 FL=1